MLLRVCGAHNFRNSSFSHNLHIFWKVSLIVRSVCAYVEGTFTFDSFVRPRSLCPPSTVFRYTAHTLSQYAYIVR